MRGYFSDTWLKVRLALAALRLVLRTLERARQSSCTRSTVQTRETIELDGKTYPLFKCDVTSESHPFYTGAQTRIVETGRVEKFRARFARTAGTVKSAS